MKRPEAGKEPWPSWVLSAARIYSGGLAKPVSNRLVWSCAIMASDATAYRAMPVARSSPSTISTIEQSQLAVIFIGGTSRVQTFSPSPTIATVIQNYSGPSATGTLTSEIYDWADGRASGN